MPSVLFLYRFEFPSRVNPRDRKEQFEENLKSYLQSNGLKYGMSALGGMRFTMGNVYRDDGDVTEQDRTALASWAMAQPIKCTAHLGEIENDHPDLELFREIDDWVFPIDNLSEHDRIDAANYAKKIDEMMQAGVKKRLEQTKDAND